MDIKVLRMKQIITKLAYAKSSIYDKVNNDLFPPRYIQKKGRSAWLESDINLFLEYEASSDYDLKWSEYIFKRESPELWNKYCIEKSKDANLTVEQFKINSYINKK